MKNNTKIINLMSVRNFADVRIGEQNRAVSIFKKYGEACKDDESFIEKCFDQYTNDIYDVFNGKFLAIPMRDYVGNSSINVFRIDSDQFSDFDDSDYRMENNIKISGSVGYGNVAFDDGHPYWCMLIAGLTVDELIKLAYCNFIEASRNTLFDYLKNLSGRNLDDGDGLDLVRSRFIEYFNDNPFKDFDSYMKYVVEHNGEYPDVGSFAMISNILLSFTEDDVKNYKDSYSYTEDNVAKFVSWCMLNRFDFYNLIEGNACICGDDYDVIVDVVNDFFDTVAMDGSVENGGCNCKDCKSTTDGCRCGDRCAKKVEIKQDDDHDDSCLDKSGANMSKTVMKMVVFDPKTKKYKVYDDPDSKEFMEAEEKFMADYEEFHKKFDSVFDNSTLKEQFKKDEEEKKAFRDKLNAVHPLLEKLYSRTDPDWF